MKAVWLCKVFHQQERITKEQNQNRESKFFLEEKTIQVSAVNQWYQQTKQVFSQTMRVCHPIGAQMKTKRTSKTTKRMILLLEWMLVLISVQKIHFKV